MRASAAQARPAAVLMKEAATTLGSPLVSPGFRGSMCRWITANARGASVARPGINSARL
jgi:hypothetical protein